MKRVVTACVLCLLVPTLCPAQTPAGMIAGVVHDASGAVVPGAAVDALSRATGQVRRTIVTERGDYSLPALLPGEYEVSVLAAGFQRMIRTATVEAGTTTTADFVLDVGEVTESVTVAAASPQMQYDSAAVGGVVTRDQISGLPLNGRSFLELSKLEAGVQLPTAGNRNRTIVHVLGAPAANVGGARFTVDGGSVTAIGLGGAQMALSQEVVQEFQLSTVNFDLAAGMTESGAINVITRGGGNDVRATAFYFFRDHHLSAYPVLTRDRRNPNPFFQRQQFGVAAGGPVRRDRLFYFANWERNDQRGVSATTLLEPAFAHFSQVTSNPLRGDLLTVRLDGRIGSAHTAFIRHSRDASRAFGPGAVIAGGSPNALPSNWNRVATAADQSLLAVTSVFGPRLVNDVRFSAFAIDTRSGRPREADCPRCLGLGAPSITVDQTGLVVGHSNALDTLERRFHFTESLTWQASAHRVRFGIDWEHNRDRNLIWNNEPVTMTLYAPAHVRAYNAQPGIAPEQRIPLPAGFDSLDDILQLPLQSMTIGLGNPGVAQEGGGVVRRWNTVWMYIDDVWRMRDRLTLTYGIGWGVDGILNHDLHKPLLLAPLLGSDGLGPTRRNWTNFSPTAGLIWTASADRRTIVRAAVGRFYRPHGLTGPMDAERVALGAPGLGRQSMTGRAILNVLPGVPGVPVGTPLEFRFSPTHFTGADLMAILPVVRVAQGQLQATDESVQQIQITKQLAAANTAIFPADVPNPSAVHANAGLQRELLTGVVVSADVVYRHFAHVPQNGGAIDLNHYHSVRGPVIRDCAPSEFSDPSALCSRGAINVYVAPYQTTYKGLLVRAEKRFSDGWQFLGSYAYSKNSGINAGTGFNLEDWRRNTGPTSNDLTHIVNLSGVLRLPWQLDLGANFTYSSAPPFTAFVGRADFDGDGTTGDPLPGTTVNAFNRGMERADLERLVGAFNRTSSGPLFAPITLPDRYSFGDDFHSLDIRLTRSFVVRSRLRVSLIGEAFNLYNAANLTEYSGDLTTSAFGQPGSRVRQVFGSGGPRAFQIAARVSF